MESQTEPREFLLIPWPAASLTWWKCSRCPASSSVYGDGTCECNVGVTDVICGGVLQPVRTPPLECPRCEAPTWHEGPCGDCVAAAVLP